MADDPIMYDYQVLQTAFQTVKQFGEQVNKLGTSLTRVHDALAEHCSGDESGIGAMVASAAKDVTGAAGKVFTEGGRVLSEMGVRGQNNGKRTQLTDEAAAKAFNDIHDSAYGDRPGAGGSSGSNGARSPADPSGPVDPPTLHDGPGQDDPLDVRTGCQDPVDPATGEMFLRQTDLELPGVLAWTFQRVHLSGYRSGRLFGRRWASTLDQRVEIDDDGIHYAAEDGMVLHYAVPTQPGERVLPSRGPRWPLAWNRREDRIEIERPEPGLTLRFPPGPVPRRLRPLAAAVDRNGNRITVVCDAEGVPTDVYHSGGYHVRAEWIDTRDGVRVSSLMLVDPAGADVQLRAFRYDARGRLAEVVDSTGLPFVFEYDDEDRVTAWINRTGYRHSYTYDALGRVVRVGGEDGALAADFAYAADERATTLTDSLGNVTVYRFDAYGRVVSVTDPLGAVTRTEYDRYGRLLSTTDALGAQTRITLDEDGNAARIEQPDGTVAEARYNEAHQPVATLGPDGTVWQCEYDERGNRIAVTAPDGSVTRYTYTDRGALSQITDTLGNISLHTSDAAGLPTSFTDPLGAVWTATRDLRGRVVELTDPLGATTRLAWDGEDNQTGAAYADGTGESWEYDADGNMVRHTDPIGAVTLFEYGPFHTIVARTDPDGARYTFTHDAQLRLTKVTNPQQADWSYAYDAAGNLTGESDFNGRRLAYAFDPAGRVVRRTNGAGEAVELTRNAMGQVVEQHAGGERIAAFEYNANGELARATTPDCVLELARDVHGRVISEAVDGRALTNAYDAAGRRTSRTTPGGRTSTWSYDAAGWPIGCAVDDRFIGFGHDAGGRATFRWLSPDTALTQEWDRLGRITARRLLTVRGPENARTAHVLHERSWTYRAEGTPQTVTDSADGTSRFTLDATGRVTAVTATNWTESYAYDAIGNLVRASDSRDPDADTAGGRELAGTLLRRAGRTSYAYDAQGRLAKKTVRTLSGGSKVWTYAYNANSQLAETVTATGERWRYRYDGLGRRVAKQCLAEDGTVTEEFRFCWDGTTLAEEEHVRAGNPQVTIVTWDYEFGSWTPMLQDRRSFLTDAPQELIDRQFHAIVTDLIGAPTELVTLDGTVAWRRSANLWGELLPGATDPDSAAPGCPLRFPGQYHDPETGFDYNIQRYYDPHSGRYATADPLGLDPSPNDYGYVDNPLRAADPLGLSVVGTKTRQYAAQVLARSLAAKVDPPTMASVVIDQRTGITYRGVSGQVPDRIHSLLRSRMDGPTLEKWRQGNCAEFNAVNDALLKGAKIEDLQYSTFRVREGTYEPSCRNCKIALQGAKEVCS
jgi:RHS repeat-associated protein